MLQHPKLCSITLYVVYSKLFYHTKLMHTCTDAHKENLTTSNVLCSTAARCKYFMYA